jgi:hypothetical protein
LLVRSRSTSLANGAVTGIPNLFDFSKGQRPDFDALHSCSLTGRNGRDEVLVLVRAYVRVTIAFIVDGSAKQHEIEVRNKAR